MIRVAERGQIEGRGCVTATGGEKIQQLRVGQPAIGPIPLGAGMGLGVVGTAGIGFEPVDDLACRIAPLLGGFGRRDRLAWQARLGRRDWLGLRP